MNVLVAGVGNVFLGDDGFGVEVARRLAAMSWPADVRVADFGIRALHLAYELLDRGESDALVLVDAVARGHAPGTVFVLEPDLARDLAEAPALEGHGMHPAAVLRTARALGAALGPVRIVGCEPASLEEGMGLSEPVERALDEAVRLVRAVVDDLRLAAGAAATS